MAGGTDDGDASFIQIFLILPFFRSDLFFIELVVLVVFFKLTFFFSFFFMSVSGVTKVWRVGKQGVKLVLPAGGETAEADI